MRIFGSSLFAILLLAYTAVAQPEASKSRGFLPQNFQLPDASVKLRFTSPSKPTFEIPVYPDVHLSSGKEGVVEVEMYVTAEGNVVYSEVTVTSGDHLFDEAALESAMKSRFPTGYATQNGQPRDFKIAVPFYFLLSVDPENYWQTRLELARLQQDYEEIMHEFQKYIDARSVTSKARLETTKKLLEEKVVTGKRLHRMLAEKKESAILRIRDEIAATKDRREATVAEGEKANDTNWRQPSDGRAASVQLAAGVQGVVTSSTPSTDDLIRLKLELEIKKSYL